MKENESVEFFMRALKEQHAALLAAMDGLYKSIGTFHGEQRKSAAKQAQGAARTLLSSLATSDQPAWLKQLIGILDGFVGNAANADAAYAALMKLFPIYPQIHGEQWMLEPRTSEYDFDAIFISYRDSSRLPDLLDELIRVLSEISQHQSIDSKKLLASLEKLIATLKTSKKGSYFSLMSSMTFLRKLATHYLKEEFSKLPGIGSLVPAFDKAMEETEVEVDKLHDAIRTDMSTKFQVDFEFLDHSKDSYLFGDRFLTLGTLDVPSMMPHHPRLTSQKESPE